MSLDKLIRGVGLGMCLTIASCSPYQQNEVDDSAQKRGVVANEQQTNYAESNKKLDLMQDKLNDMSERLEELETKSDDIKKINDHVEKICESVKESNKRLKEIDLTAAKRQYDFDQVKQEVQDISREMEKSLNDLQKDKYTRENIDFPPRFRLDDGFYLNENMEIMVNVVDYGLNKGVSEFILRRDGEFVSKYFTAEPLGGDLFTKYISVDDLGVKDVHTFQAEVVDFGGNRVKSKKLTVRYDE